MFAPAYATLPPELRYCRRQDYADFIRHYSLPLFSPLELPPLLIDAICVCLILIILLSMPIDAFRYCQPVYIFQRCPQHIPRQH